VGDLIFEVLFLENGCKSRGLGSETAIARSFKGFLSSLVAAACVLDKGSSLRSG
jgi:hypothetical protein